MNPSIELNNFSRTLPKLIIFQQPFIYPSNQSPYLNNLNLLSPLKLPHHKKAKPQFIQANKSRTTKKYSYLSDESIERPFKLQKLNKVVSKQLVIITQLNLPKEAKKLIKWSNFTKKKLQNNLVKSQQIIPNIQGQQIQQQQQNEKEPSLSLLNSQKRQRKQEKDEFKMIYHNEIIKRLNHRNERKKGLKTLYRVYFGQGNNSQLVKGILLSRMGWIETVQHDSIFNLRWQQSTDKAWYKRIKFDRYKQTVNHLQMHQELSTKSGLLRNLKRHCYRKNYNLYDIVPISFVLDWNNGQKLQQQLKRFVFYYFENHPSQKNRKIQKQYIEMTKALNNYDCKLFNYSFQKSRSANIPQLTDIYNDSNNSYVWMLKPSDLNRGRGIKIWSSFQELTQLLIQSRMEKSLSNTFVIQKYIERPLLINNRKFDIRVWALVDHKRNLYFFQEGYIRTSSQQYQLNDLKDIFVHLTNNAIQIGSSKYGTFQDGNQLSFSQFDKIFPNLAPFKGQILPLIKNMSLIAVQSAMRNILPKWIDSSLCFQIFGLDFILDYNGRPWLIQVNTNPCLEASSKILKILLPRMLDDAFKIVLDPIYPPGKSSKVYHVQGYEDSHNLWELMPMTLPQKDKSKQL